MSLKLGFLICATALIVPLGQAQVSRGFGLKVGAVSASQTWDFQDNYHFPAKPRWGYDAGLFIEPFALPSFSVLVEIHYVQKGFKVTLPITTPAYPEGTGENVTINTRFEYVSIPLLAKLRFEANDLTPYFFAGPRMDMLIGHPSDNISLPLEKFKKTDAGVSIGIGVEIPLQSNARLLAEFRYSPSLTGTYNNRGLKITNQSIELLVGAELQ